MRTALDSNVLFDLIAGDAGAADTAEKALLEAGRSGAILVCPVTYAELVAGFASASDAKRLFADLGVKVEPFSEEALAEAASAWKRYVFHHGSEVQCPRCGHRAHLPCPKCRSPLVWRQHIISDFLIGGHALRQADRLLTRDLRYYRTYFPTLRLATP